MFGKFLGAALAASLFCASAAEAQQQDCALKQIASLPITTTASGKIAVPVVINGLQYLFAVELADDFSGVSANFAEQLKLETALLPNRYRFGYRDRQLTGDQHFEVTHQAVLPKLQLGAVAVDKVVVALLPQFESGETVQGILGGDILHNYDVEFDFAGRKLNLFLPEACPGKAVYWAGSYAAMPMVVAASGTIDVSLSLDDKPVDAEISTDPGHAEMPLQFGTSLRGVAMDSPDLKQTGWDRDEAVYRYPFHSLAFGGVAIRDPDIDLLATHDSCTHNRIKGWKVTDKSRDLCGAPLIVRLSEIEKLHLYFAFGEKKLYVTAADAHK